MNFISISLYNKVVNHALEEGLAPKSIAHLKIPEQPSKGPHVVPADVFFELHEIVDRELFPGCSVRVGAQMKMDDYGVLGLSWKTCSMAREIFERSERYFKLLSNTYVFKVVDENEISKIHLLRDNYRRGVALSNEATFSATVKVIQAITATDIAPIEVAFKHEPPKEMASYNDCFKCPVLFNQAVNYIAYTTTDLNTRTAKADISINKFLVERVTEEVKGIEIGANQLANEIKALIKDALPSGIPSKSKIGRHIGMSERTLTRRLSANGVTFRALIESTQQEISKSLLSQSDQSIGEIAFQAGFSEQSAFNRAFKRWTNQSPTDFRKK